MAYKRIYIGIGTSITALVVIFIVLQSLGLQIMSDGNKRCAGTIADPCVSYINITNPTANSIYIYNKEGVKLDFSPEIKDYNLYVKYYGKWVKTEFTNSTRLPNIPKDAKYVFIFPRYSKKEFKLEGYKINPADRIKWSLEIINKTLDPIWDSPYSNKFDYLDFLEDEYVGKCGFLTDCKICFNITQTNEVICAEGKPKEGETIDVYPELQCNDIDCSVKFKFTDTINKTRDYSDRLSKIEIYKSVPEFKNQIVSYTEIQKTKIDNTSKNISYIERIPVYGNAETEQKITYTSKQIQSIKQNYDYKEYANWSSSGFADIGYSGLNLSVGLLAYYSMNSSNDSTLQYNLINTNIVFNNTAIRHNASHSVANGNKLERANDDNAFDFGTKNFTIAFAILYRGDAGGNGLISKFPGGNDGWILYSTAGVLSTYIEGGTVNMDGGNLNNNRWEYWIFNRNSSHCSWFNGSELGISMTATDATCSGDFDAGALSYLTIHSRADNGAAFKGGIDEVGIWNRSLRVDEMRNLSAGCTYSRNCFTGYIPPQIPNYSINFCGNITSLIVYGRRNGTFQPEGQNNVTCLYNVTNYNLSDISINIKLNQTIGLQYRLFTADDFSQIDSWTPIYIQNFTSNNTCLFRTQNITNQNAYMELIYSFKWGCINPNQLWINFTNKSNTLITRNFTGFDKLFYKVMGSGARADNISLLVEDNDGTRWEGYPQSLKARNWITVWHNITSTNWTQKAVGSSAGMDWERIKKFYFNIYYGGNDLVTFNDSLVNKSFNFTGRGENRTFSIFVANYSVYSAVFDVTGINMSGIHEQHAIDDFEDRQISGIFVNQSNQSSTCDTVITSFPCNAGGDNCAIIEERNDSADNRGYLYLNVTTAPGASGTCYRMYWLFYNQDLLNLEPYGRNLTLNLKTLITVVNAPAGSTSLFLFITGNTSTEQHSLGESDDGIIVYDETTGAGTTSFTDSIRNINLTIDKAAKRVSTYNNGTLFGVYDISSLSHAYLKIVARRSVANTGSVGQSVIKILDFNWTEKDAFPNNISITLGNFTIFESENDITYRATTNDFASKLELSKNKNAFFNITSHQGELKIDNIRIDYNRSKSLYIDEITFYNNTQQSITGYINNGSNFSTATQLTTDYQNIINISSNQSKGLWLWLVYKNVTLGNYFNLYFDATFN